MNENEHARSTSDQKPQGAAIFTVLGAVAGLAALPQAFEQYPRGAAIVAGVVVAGYVTCVIVTLIKNRRR